MPTDQHQTQITALREVILELKMDIKNMSDRQEEMVEDIKKIKEAVYNPDEGLYARLRELEQWKDTTAKVMWVIITTIVGLTTTTVYKIFI
jgi:gamma-glutamylcyclotransferase (GGCT)/AIG2-like uncharacterized protein YtfP